MVTMTITHPRPTLGHARRPKATGITWRDQVATFFVGCSTLVAWAVLTEAGWPLLGSVRSGAIAAGIFGFAACALGAKLDDDSFSSTYVRFMSVLGAGTLGVLVAAIATGLEALLVTLAALTVALWIVATTKHSMGR
jgi:hypothetical protein